LTNGVITAIALPVVSGNNLFTAAPTISVYGGGLPTTTATLNPYNITTGGYSLYQNIKRLRFDLNQEYQSIKLANGAVMFLEYIRMPALSNLSTCYKKYLFAQGAAGATPPLGCSKATEHYLFRRNLPSFYIITFSETQNC